MHRLLIVSAGLFASAAAVAPASAQTVYGLVGSDRIVTFDAATPGSVTSSRAITGLAMGEVLTGIDVRPVDRALYSMSTTGNLYRLTLSGGSYTASLVGPTSAITGSNFGIDFNPTVDRLRFVSDADQNLRINPADGVTVVDGMINPAGFDLIGSGYANSFAGATTTALFGIDAAGDSLVRSSNANAGTYFTVGSLGLGGFGADARVGFDLLATGGGNAAFLALNDLFYTVNLTTGSATLVGSIGSQNITGISAAIPEPATWAMMIGGFGLVGAAMRRRVRALPATA